MAVDTKEKQSKEQTGSVLEDPNAIVEQISKSEQFIKKYRNVIFGAIILIAGGVYGLITLNNNAKEEEQNAQLDFYKAQYYYGLDSINLALNGNADVIGLYELAETYADNKVGNLSNFMIGTLEMEQGNFEEAIASLKAFESDDLIIQGRAYCLIGDAYMEQDDLDNAITYYKKASSYNPNSQFTPRYRSKLALAYELKGNLAEAISTYESIVADFPRAQKGELDNAKKFLARARALQAQN